MPTDPTDRGVLAVLPPIGIHALRASPCGMVHERIKSGPDGLPLRNAATGGYRRPGICSAAVRNGNLGCSHTMARVTLMRALDGMEGDGIEALRQELQALDAALGVLDHRRYEAEDQRADALLARDEGAETLAEAKIRAIIADHRTRGLRVGEIRDLLASRLEDGASGAGRPGQDGEAPTSRLELAGQRSPSYPGS